MTFSNRSLFVLGVSVLALAAAPAHAVQLNTTSRLFDTAPAQSIPAPTPAPETQFDPAIEDLPLMPGLEPVAGEDTLFVVPRAGRIAESNAVGAVDIDDVYNFYRKSLPHLGWKILDARTYMRDNEQLRIDAHANGKITTVRFSIKPL
jgi:hypothetical protein